MNNFFIGAAGICAVAGLSALVSVLPPQVKASVALFLALPQLYLLPAGHIDVPLTTIVSVLFLPNIFIQAKRDGSTGLLRLLAALLAVRLLALAWSPDPRSGLQSISLLGQFIITLLVMSAAVRQDPDILRRLHLTYWPWVVFESFIVIFFRIQPAAKEAFLHSAGGLFAGHNAIDALLGGDNPNNVLDPSKSGGFFVNANVAAMFLGVNALAALAVSSRTRTKWIRVVGLTALAAVPFTGSKSATILALTLPIIALSLHRARRMSTPTTRRYLIIGLVSLGIAGILFINSLNLALLGNSAEALDERTSIWGFGAEAFRRNPLLGLGYGGWDLGFKSYAATQGLFRSFPPHDILLAAWSTTGIPGLLLTVGFFALILRLVIRSFSGDGIHEPKFVIYAGAALGWILIQGMGENTDVFGDVHLIPISSLLVAFLARCIGEGTQENATYAHRRDRETPALPAVRNVHHQSGLGVARFPTPVRRKGPISSRAGRPFS